MSTCSELKKASLQLKSIVKEEDFCNRGKVEESINTLLVSLDYLYMEKSYSEISKKTYNKVETFIENAICNLKKSLKIDCQSSPKEIEKKIKKAICYISKAKRCLNCKDCPIVPVCSYINNAQIPPVPYSLDPLNVSGALMEDFYPYFPFPLSGYLFGNGFVNVDGTIAPIRIEIANRYLKSDFDGKKIDSVQFGLFNSPRYRGENKDYNLIFKIYNSNNLQNLPGDILSSISVPVSSLVFSPGSAELGFDIQVCIVSIPLSVAIQKIIGKYFFVAVNFEEGNNDSENKFLLGLLNTSNAAFNPTWVLRTNEGIWTPTQNTKNTLYTSEAYESDVWINPLLCPYEEPFPRKEFFGKVYYACDIQVGIPNVSVWAWAPGYGDSNAPYAIFSTDENGNWKRTLPEGTPPVSWTFSVQIPDDGHVSDWICVTSNQVQVVNPSDPTTTIPVGFLADKINVSGKVNRTCNLEIFKEGEKEERGERGEKEKLKSGLIKKIEKYDNFQTVSLFSNVKNLSDLTDFLIVPVNILGDEKKLKVVKNNVYSSLYIIQGTNNLHYNGIIEDDVNSLVALNIHDGKVNGLISNSKYGNLEIIYENGEYKFIKTGNSGFKCLLDDNLSPLNLNVSSQNSQERCVEVWLDVGNSIYNLFEGDLIRITNYVEDLMNIVSSIYEVENVNLKLGEFKIWETLEPFFGIADTATLNAYRNYRRPGQTGDDWVGDVAHYINFYGITQGIAFLNVLCNRNFSYGVVNVESLAINPYPSSLSSAWVLAHELGHSLGSEHTFKCTWPNGYLSNPGAIDGSFDVEGNCLLPPFPETNQSTIMGYAGNFPLSNSFGTPLGGIYVQPGNVIRNTVARAPCVACNKDCPILVRINTITPATSSVTANGAITIIVSGATQYSFLWSNGAVTQNVNGLSCGSYSVTVTDVNKPECQVTLEDIVVPTILEDMRVNVNVKGGPCNIDENIVLTGSNIDYSFNIDPIIKGILEPEKRIYTITITRLENTTKFTSVFGVLGDNFSPSVSLEIDINTLFVSSLSQILGVTSVQ